MFYVYVLQSQRHEKLYIGDITNWKKRLKQHNRGESLATKPYRPYEIIFYEAFLNKKDTKNREKYLRSGWGWRSIKKMLANYLKDSSKL